MIGLKVPASLRMLSANLPKRVLVTSTAPMSSASPAQSPSSSSSQPSTQVKPTPKRESVLSFLASVFGGKVDPADPKFGPLDSNRVNFPDTVEQATGEQKLLLLAFENGFLDPYCNLPTERNGRGSKDNPVLVESFINERMVACICEPTQSFVRYTNLYKDEPKRCQCGHWMKLVEAPKFWEHIPREDLLTIPFFQEMEQDGLLDKLLSGELDREIERKQLEEHHDDHHHH